MRNTINRLLLLAFVAVTACFVIFAAWQVFSKNTAPVITCASEVIEVSVNSDDAALLQGVTATDKEDGDLTADVVVESVSKFVQRGVCRVIYAVQDSENAVTKLTREVRYTDYTAPRFALSAPLEFMYSPVIDPTTVLTATDCFDGDITDEIKASLMGDSAAITGAGDWKVQFRVTNSKGETAYLNTVIKVYDSLTNTEKYYRPNIELTDRILYLPVGSSFRTSDYIQSVTVEAPDALDSLPELRARVVVDTAVSDTVDTSKVGSYVVRYSCTSSEGYTGTADLTVVVYE